MAKKNGLKIKFLTVFVFTLVLELGVFYFVPVLAVTNNGNVNVQLNVPGGGGTGGGGDVTPPTDNYPVISGVSTSTSFTTTEINWSAADDHGITTVGFVYGTLPIYGNSGVINGTYQVALTGLSEDTLYYFKISVTDTAGQTTVYTGTFKTLSQLHPAPNINGVQIEVGMTTATVKWTTNQQADSQINYGLTSAYGNSLTDNNLVILHSLYVSNLLPDTVYHYRIVSTNNDGNSTSTTDVTFTTKKDTVPPPDVSNFNLTTTTNSINLTWQNPSLGSVPDFGGVKVVRKIDSRSTNINDGNLVYGGTGESFNDVGVIKDEDYFYTVFSFDTSGNYSPGIYRNGIIPTITPPPPPPPPPPPTTTPPTTTVPPVIPPTEKPPDSTVPSFLKINLSDLSLLVGNRQIKLNPSGDTFSALSGTALTVSVPENILAHAPQSMVLEMSSDKHQFVYNSSNQTYYAELSFPNLNVMQVYLNIDYGVGQIDNVGFKLSGLPYGLVSENNGALTGANVNLVNQNGTQVPLENYGEQNPLMTDANGFFGWEVPNGSYSLTVQKDGYYDLSVPYLAVSNNAINSRLNLIKRPQKLLDVIKPDAPLAENVANVAKNLVSQTQAITAVTVQQINEAVQNPAVQQTNQQVVAPTAIAVVAVGAIPLISWMDLLPLLRLLFLQPLLLVGGRKREKWGVVYNALSKQPIDLAIIRLLNAENGKVIQSKVTDAQGHYIFIVDPGKYKMEVRKNNFVFPSVLLSGFTSDGQKVDIYHGEMIEVTDKGAAIAVNVPLDPAGAVKRPSRLVWEKIGRRAQALLSWAGIIVTALSLYISPKWYIGALLAVHVILFFLFRRLAMPPKSKNWGIVYEGSNKNPVGRVIARLFNSQFNKLVATEITDNKGRYSFLAGDDSYYITYEHKDFQPHKTENIDLHGKNSEAIAPDVELKKH